ncbi:gluconeogenesis factor YvcK family protein [Actinophytocola algeriensis]|uniref:Putative gluconeogenesis factor n=1 Tax=Actinophytocola algeriensis TaxID=1768010 RepID=A0A7W7Q8X4_9PSEU|nr:uridine diphosphate-N-acetylglucosamine-binding protein YvcK [Actinophytocola algeriensis]MBB4909048.1 putative cofD-like protein [Actinophytocola algeriensis]MBE1474564.1 putative cofD-like protein [Actinophytocola algeriensis]
MKAVALGGGRGLHATLSALRRLTPDVTAVVTVADDGGSSGRLRRELGLLPPGDLRKALAALAGDDDGNSLWATVFQHRFGGTGALAGHAVGNLVLAALLELLDDPVTALDEAARLLGLKGRVLPMCTEPLDIEADVVGLDEDPAAVRRIRGQVAVATTPGQVRRIRLHTAGEPDDVPKACPAAVTAVREADVVLLGPGSWFTSVLPHLLVPELHEALIDTAASRIVVLNLVPQPGETAGFSPERHLDVLCEHAPRLRVDAVIADADSVPTPDRLRTAAESLGARLRLDAIAAAGTRERHDPAALAESLRGAFDEVTSARRDG